MSAEKVNQKKTESANQGRSRSARQGAESNSTWRRSLTGSGQGCFDSKDPCRSVWRFSEKQFLTHFSCVYSGCCRSPLLGHGKNLAYVLLPKRNPATGPMPFRNNGLV